MPSSLFTSLDNIACALMSNGASASSGAVLMHTTWKLSIIIESFMKSKILANITPGEILEQDFLKPLRLSQYRVAKDIGFRAGATHQ
jgi:hypothetical protein